MELRWTDNQTKSIGVTYVADEDAKILRFIGYETIDNEYYTDKDGEYIEVWMPKDSLYKDKLHKWVAFKQEGMSCVLHGKVVETYGDGIVAQCKNGCERYVNIQNCYKFFDKKEECYSYK